MEEVVGSNPTRSTNCCCMPFVYILRSDTSGRFYIGCAEQPLGRLTEHQRGQTIYTRGRGPWTLVHEELFETLSEAPKRERQLKGWKSHRSIQELIDAWGPTIERAPA
jgi:putative endonuclease